LERNTIVGVDFLIFAFIILSLGILAQNVPMASFAIAVAIIGAVTLLVVPEQIPQDAYKALLGDAIKNVEMLLVKSAIREKAIFFQNEDGNIRAFIPISESSQDNGPAGPLSSSSLQGVRDTANSVIFRDQKGFLLVPPGAQLVEFTKVEKGAELEDALYSVLVEFSDLASSVHAVDEEGSKSTIIQIGKPKVTWNAPYFTTCLGSPASCVAACVVAAVKGQPVKIVDETVIQSSLRLTLETV
jgi:hypothetical protein